MYDHNKDGYIDFIKPKKGYDKILFEFMDLNDDNRVSMDEFITIKLMMQ
jgi:hypothetical protein